ncbi:hypothetical protein SAMN05216345_10353 [Cupriavidus sp. YR651]|nr:hypothetical protein SAMN05216345_10353 [Cupriavidus sp. YR651]
MSGFGSYTGEDQLPHYAMEATQVRIPASRLVTLGCFPLTREGAINLARLAGEEPFDEAQIVLTAGIEADGLDIELATIELARTPNDSWRLQYVSHPEQSCQLTAGIFPCHSDYSEFIRMYMGDPRPTPLTPICAQELQDEGLGPLAILDLRPHRPVPVVPHQRDVAALLGLYEARAGSHRL